MNRQQHIGNIAEVLLEYFENQKTFQSNKIMTVPASSYTDANQWRAEIDLIFKRVPLMLALSCEMPCSGDYKAMDAAGLPVLIARDKEATVRAFLNVCAHRWAPVVAEGYGNCTRFTCPFHGWTYATDGKLIGIPDRAKFGDIHKSMHGLKELPCEERNGMIFVCLTPGAQLELDRYCGALLEDFAEAGLKDWTLLGSSVFDGANWKLVLDNFFESYHFATLHPKTVALEYVPNVSHYEGFGPNMRIGFALRSIAKLRETPRAQWSQLETREFSFMRYFFPNVIGSLLPSDYSAFIQIFPQATPDKSRIVVIYARKQPLKDAADREEVEEYMKHGDHLLREEDFAIGLQTQKRLESGAHAGLLYGRNERGNQYFHEWLNWHLQGDSTLPKPIM